MTNKYMKNTLHSTSLAIRKTQIKSTNRMTQSVRKEELIHTLLVTVPTESATVKSV